MLLGLDPDQRTASAAMLREKHPGNRTRLGRATDPAAITGLTGCRFGGRIHVQPDGAPLLLSESVHQISRLGLPEHALGKFPERAECHRHNGSSDTNQYDGI